MLLHTEKKNESLDPGVKVSGSFLAGQRQKKKSAPENNVYIKNSTACFRANLPAAEYS